MKHVGTVTDPSYFEKFHRHSENGRSLREI